MSSASQSRSNQKKFFNRFLKYTETIFYWLTICYFIWQFASLALIVIAIIQTQQFSFLDAFITETNTTFRDVAGVVIIKFLVENVFKYNTFGDWIKHKPAPTDDQENLPKSDAELLEEQNSENI